MSKRHGGLVHQESANEWVDTLMMCTALHVNLDCSHGAVDCIMVLCTAAGLAMPTPALGLSLKGQKGEALKCLGWVNAALHSRTTCA